MNSLQAAGAHADRDTRWAPIFTNRFFLGLWTNRNPLRAPTGVIYENYYRLGGTDALIAGTNVEISNRLTICRRPGHTAGLAGILSSGNVPDIPLSFIPFHELTGDIHVFDDTASAIFHHDATAIYPIFTKAPGAGQSFYQGIGQTLYFSDSKEQQKWIDPSSYGQITNTALTSNVVTITFVEFHQFVLGDTVTITGTTNGGGVFNGQFVITSLPTANSLTFTLNSADVPPAADTGEAVVLKPGQSASLITGTQLTSGVATITAINAFAVGQTVVVSNTANGSGIFNGTFKITAANSAQFQFSLSSTDVAFAADSGFANATWNWAPTAPTSAPTLNIVASGSAATTWQPSTEYTTMGFIVDANGNVQQLISVNALGGNTTQYGTSGSGGPNWNQTPGGTTIDNTITWTNWGPIGTWGARKVFNNNAVGGTLTNPALIFDPTTGHIQINGRPSLLQGTTGASYPKFSGVLGSIVWDGTVKWFDIGPPALWVGSHVYGAYGVGQTLASHAVAEPILPPSTQTIFWQVSGGGTSSPNGIAPPFATTPGFQTSDNQLQWLCLGSATWAPSANYTQWTGTSPVFSAVKDSNGNMQVCVVSGTSGSTQPLPQWIAGHVYGLNTQIVDSNLFVQKVTTGGTSGVSATLSNTVLASTIATYTTTAPHGYSVGQLVTVTGSTNDATFNVTNAPITAVTANTFTVNIAHDDITSAADAGTAKAGPTWNSTVGGTTTDGTVTWTNQGAENVGGRPAQWGFNYGDKTPDGSVTWTCVGPPSTWAASTQWHLPTAGFAPPSASEPYGGSEVKGSNFVQAVIQSGKSAPVIQPNWSTTIGNFVLDPSNTTSQIIWRNISAFSQNSISWTKGYGYTYAFKARAVTDLYAPLAGGGGGVLLGSSASTPSPLVDQGTQPTGSADGSVSSAAPTVQMAVGPNSGSVVFISGLGSTDPQVDTISIFRTFDGGATYFWLTDIKNPSPANGQAQAWTFADFLPDVATSTFSGLNILVLAPINHSNDPPPQGAINLVQYFGRVFCSVGATVFCSQGPAIGGPSQPPGNGYTAFNPGQFFTFTSPVRRLVPTNIGLLAFTTSDLGIISGGPNIGTMFPNIYIPGLGLASYNALAVRGGLIDLFTADNQVVTLDPNQGGSKVGYPIGDQFFKYGAQTTTFSPSSAYLTFHTQGLNDEALFVADGSTGWFRGVTNLAPDSAISGPVWSPKASVIGGAKAIASLEVAPGQHALLVGGTAPNQPVLVRDSTYSTFSDAGTAYPANFTFGSMVLANPGQLAELGFITCEFVKTGSSPKLSVMLDEIADSAMTITAASQSGQNTTYTYTLISGYPVVVGSGVTVSGMANPGNNGTFPVASTGVGTFTVVNPHGVTAVGQSGAGTLFEDLTNYTAVATGLPPQDSPWRYGLTLQAASLYTNRYYFAQSVGGIEPPQGTFCRHMQVKIDFGLDTVQNEILTQTIYGAHWNEP